MNSPVFKQDYQSRGTSHVDVYGAQVMNTTAETPNDVDKQLFVV
ncbi:hypothetical protein MJO28_001806 [Puccinia striiformis f. sp. tritici]|uniref:Uncharacterized protein n=1 Tax=Puccinia striiformis f. sp. tritici TaxID=168172 RepID=A0ACC0EVE4_9BASI|nr:hypothetical protein MJO28_001806 [Puccinia striiformis f. sp. tritici]